MSLQIIEEARIHWTVWKVVDQDGELIARFDSRGGYTRADAEAIVREAAETEYDNRIARSELWI